MGFRTTPGGFPVSVPTIQSVSSDPTRWVERVRGQSPAFQTAFQGNLIWMTPFIKSTASATWSIWKANVFPA